MKLLSKVEQRAFQAAYVMRLFFGTLSIWSFSDWRAFWFGKSGNARIGSLGFRVRTDSMVNKISDLAMIFEVAHYGAYKKAKIEPEDTVVDIGGHIGGFSIMAAKMANKGKVYVYEPMLSTFEFLKKNIEINGLKNVKASNEAVGKEIKDSFIYMNDLNLAENSLYRETKNKQKIKVINLEKVFKDNGIRKCNVLKLDCEGAEYDILFSSEKMLGKIDKIILEYHDPEHFNLPEDYSIGRLVSYLKKNGFEVTFDKDRNYQGILYAEKLKS